MRTSPLDYSKYAIKDFNIKYNDQEIRVSLSAHMYQARKGQNYKRGFMFKTTGQIKKLLQYALEKYSLLEYKDKGKVGIMFTYTSNTYGLLVSVETKNENIVSIKIVTVDKVEERHYKEHVIFVKEKNKIMMHEYELKRSYMKYASECIQTMGYTRNKRSKKYHILSTEKKHKQIIELFKRVTAESITSALVNKIYDESLYTNIVNGGAFWVKAVIGDNIQLIKFSIEELGGKMNAVIYLDAITGDADAIKKISVKTNFLSISLKHAQIVCRKLPTGLKIVKRGR